MEAQLHEPVPASALRSFGLWREVKDDPGPGELLLEIVHARLDREGKPFAGKRPFAVYCHWPRGVDPGDVEEMFLNLETARAVRNWLDEEIKACEQAATQKE